MWYAQLIQFKKQIAIVLVVLLVAVVIFYAVKQFSQPKAEEAPLPEDQPDGVLTQSEEVQVSNLATLLYEDMDGWFDARNNDLYRTLSMLSDKLLVAVYNTFNQKYFSKGYGTLRTWLLDESYTAFTGNLVRNSIIPRMDKLKLV